MLSAQSPTFPVNRVNQVNIVNEKLSKLSAITLNYQLSLDLLTAAYPDNCPKNSKILPESTIHFNITIYTIYLPILDVTKWNRSGTTKHVVTFLCAIA